MRTPLDAIKVVPYREELRAAFEQLNREWIEQYFELEEADRKVFSDPEARILGHGGQIFFVLAERADRVVPRAEIYQLVWGNRMPYRDRSVDVFVRKVRNKLEICAPDWTFLHTHFGIGYRFAPEPKTDSS